MCVFVLLCHRVLLCDLCLICCGLCLLYMYVLLYVSRLFWVVCVHVDDIYISVLYVVLFVVPLLGLRAYVLFGLFDVF